MRNTGENLLQIFCSAARECKIMSAFPKSSHTASIVVIIIIILLSQNE